MNMRMVPIQMVFSRFPRLIRDIAGKMNKKIDLVFEGVETEIDRVWSTTYSILLFTFSATPWITGSNPPRNVTLGQTETGKIVLKATHEGDSIVIEVRDDGKGVDTRSTSESHRQGMYPREVAEKCRPRPLVHHFPARFSTADEVSNISGRGVGMDAVKRKIEEIGGRSAFRPSRARVPRSSSPFPSPSP